MDKFARFTIDFEQHPEGYWSATLKGTTREESRDGWTPGQALDALYPEVQKLRFPPVGQMKRREAITA